MTSRYGEALARAKQRPDFIDLIDTNFHSCGLYPPAAPLRAAAEEYLSEDTRLPYAPDPAGSEELRREIAKWYTSQKWPTEPTDLIITASASESYALIFSALLEQGTEIALPRPGYPLFEEIARRNGLIPRFYELAPDNGWRIDIDSLVAAVGRQCACIVLISPNNPTGTVATVAELSAVAECATQAKAMVLSDEVFSAFVYRGTHIPIGREYRQLRVCTIGGVSKLFAAPDLKVSWIRFSGNQPWREHARERIEIENDLYLNGSSLSQALATSLFAAAASPGQELARTVRRRIMRFVTELETLQERLLREESSLSLSWTQPEGGIHLPLTVREEQPAHDDESLAINALNDYALSTHPGYLYGIYEETVLILSVLCPEERAAAGLRRLGDLLLRQTRPNGPSQGSYS